MTELVFILDRSGSISGLEADKTDCRTFLSPMVMFHNNLFFGGRLGSEKRKDISDSS